MRPTSSRGRSFGKTGTSRRSVARNCLASLPFSAQLLHQQATALKLIQLDPDKSCHDTMTLKLRASHLAPPAYAHLKEYVVLSGNWRIGSISEKRAGKGWFWALGVGTPFDPDKVKMHGSQSTPDEAKRSSRAWEKWLEWADLAERQQTKRLSKK